MSRVIGDFTLDDGPVLVTGAAGFVGSRLMKLFHLGKGDIATDLNTDFQAPEGVRKIAWKLPGPPPGSLGQVRYVIHLAGLSSVAHSHTSEEKVKSVNYEGTRSVLRWLKEVTGDALLLFASSAEVYKPSKDILHELSPLDPRSPYGKSKLEAEKLISDSGVQNVIARSFPHFGPGQAGHFVLPSFCRRVIRSVRSGEGVISTGNLNAVRDYLYIDDVVMAYASLLANGQHGEVYNVCSGNGNSIGDLLALITSIPGAGLRTMIDPGLLRQEDQFCQIGSPAKLKTLGWTPENSLEKSLELLYKWWEERL